MELMDLKQAIEDQEKDNYINILVSRKRVEWIACHFTLSEHAQLRFIQRDSSLNRDLKTCIRRSPLCWKQVDGTICVALDLFSYVVVDDSSGTPVIVTFINTKDYGYNVFERAMVEYKKFVVEKRGE